MKVFRFIVLCLVFIAVVTEASEQYLARGNGSKFQTHLPYFKENKIAAYNWGFVAGKIQTQYPWSSWRRKFTAEPGIWHHDILRPDGTPFDKSEVDLIKSLTNKKK